MRNRSFYPTPPGLAEKILSLIVSQEDHEVVLGDIHEIFVALHARWGPVRAGLWYSTQVARSAPALVYLKITGVLERRFGMSNKFLVGDRNFALIGLLGLLPAVLLVIPGLLQSSLGITAPNDGLSQLMAQSPLLALINNPLTVLGGLLLAFLANISRVTEMRWASDAPALMITLKGKALQWAVVGTSILLLAALLTYAFFENFRPALQ